MNGNVSALCDAWLEAKRDENAANKRRISIEEQLSEALDVRDEGSITHDIDTHKVTLTQPVSRKIDMDAWENLQHDCPSALWPIKTKIEADPAGCKYLADKEPAIWRAISDAFTVKPGKISVKVEKL